MNQIPLLGEFFALSTAVLWGLSVILFKVSGLNIRPLALNLFKNSLGFTCLMITLPFLGQSFFLEAPISDYVWLILSGVVGIAISDTLFFASLNRLGASSLAVIECLYSPFVIFFAYVFLSERLGFLDLIGAALIISSVLLPNLGRRVASNIPRNVRLEGLIYGILSMLTVAVAIVIIKPLIEKHPLVWVTTMRMGGGVLGLLVYAVFHPQRASFFAGFKPQSAWKVAVPASFLASYFVLMMWVAGFKYAKASVAGLLNQTSVIFIVVFAMIFLKEKLNPRKIAALALALMGSVLVIL